MSSGRLKDYMTAFGLAGLGVRAATADTFLPGGDQTESDTFLLGSEIRTTPPNQYPAYWRTWVLPLDEDGQVAAPFIRSEEEHMMEAFPNARTVKIGQAGLYTWKGQEVRVGENLIGNPRNDHDYQLEIRTVAGELLHEVTAPKGWGDLKVFKPDGTAILATDHFKDNPTNEYAWLNLDSGELESLGNWPDNLYELQVLDDERIGGRIDIDFDNGIMEAFVFNFKTKTIEYQELINPEHLVEQLLAQKTPGVSENDTWYMSLRVVSKDEILVSLYSSGQKGRLYIVMINRDQEVLRVVHDASIRHVSPDDLANGYLVAEKPTFQAMVPSDNGLALYDLDTFELVGSWPSGYLDQKITGVEAFPPRPFLDGWTALFFGLAVAPYAFTGLRHIKKSHK